MLLLLLWTSRRLCQACPVGMSLVHGPAVGVAPPGGG